MINRMSRYLILFPLLAAVCAGFLAASDLAGGHKVGVSVAHAATPEGFIEIFTWKGKLDAEFLSALKDANAKRILELGAEAPG